MSVSIDISTNGYIIESQNYLSNYLVTINTDQNIYGIKTLEENLIFKDTSGNTGIYSLSTIILNDDLSRNIVLDTSNGLLITDGSTRNSKYCVDTFEINDISNSLIATTTSIILKNDNNTISYNTSGVNGSSIDISSNILTLGGNSGNLGQILTSNGNGSFPSWENRNIYGMYNTEKVKIINDTIIREKYSFIINESCNEYTSMLLPVLNKQTTEPVTLAETKQSKKQSKQSKQSKK